MLNLNYDIIIATRNRLSVLKTSLPLFINQTRKAKSIIIVDSSDDHIRVKTVCESICNNFNTDIKLTIVQSRCGAAFQRNLGLKYSDADIIFFPDDDSLWYPDYTENVLMIYEIDSCEKIGGVQGNSVKSPPPGVFKTNFRPHSVSLKDKISLHLGSANKTLNWKLFEDPLFIEGQSRHMLLPMPENILNDVAIPSAPMTGFAMSFRSNMIKKYRFDEDLGVYSLFEDRDASLSVMGEKMVFIALNAKVYHYRVPGPRSHGKEWGVMHILNRAYVVCKHSTPASKPRKALKAYLLYKIFRYLLQTNNSNGYQRLYGSIKAYFQVVKLLRATKKDLPSVYLAAKKECLNTTSSVIADTIYI